MARLGHRLPEAESLTDTPTRAARRTCRATLITDFKNAAQDPITMKYLGFFSIHDGWICLVVKTNFIFKPSE